MPPKNMESSTFTYARPPRNRPTARFARLTIFEEISPALMNSPIRMKNGMDSSEKLFAPSIIWRIITEKFVPVTSALPSVESSMAKQIGTLKINRPMNPPMRMIPASTSVIGPLPPFAWRPRPPDRCSRSPFRNRADRRDPEFRAGRAGSQTPSRSRPPGWADTATRC